MMKNISFLLLALTAGMMVSCSTTLSEQPPKTVTDPSLIASYQKARQGDIKSLKYIAECYSKGKGGFPVSLRQAINCYETAAKLGDVESQRITGSAYMLGKGRIQSYSDARKYFQMAFVQGDRTAARLIDELEERIRKEEQEQAQRRYDKQMQQARETNTLMNIMLM